MSGHYNKLTGIKLRLNTFVVSYKNTVKLDYGISYLVWAGFMNDAGRQRYLNEALLGHYHHQGWIQHMYVI